MVWSPILYHQKRNDKVEGTALQSRFWTTYSFLYAYISLGQDWAFHKLIISINSALRADRNPELSFYIAHMIWAIWYGPYNMGNLIKVLLLDVLSQLALVSLYHWNIANMLMRSTAMVLSNYYHSWCWNSPAKS